MTVASKIGVSELGLLQIREQRGNTNLTMPSNTASEQRVTAEGNPVGVAREVDRESQDFL